MLYFVIDYMLIITIDLKLNYFSLLISFFAEYSSIKDS